jgi:hypothetical protein
VQWLGSDDRRGFVYVLSNKNLRPGLLKIGRTIGAPEARARQLYTTGVPGPFVVEFSVEFKDHVAAEVAVHKYFKQCRENDFREFFAVDLKEVKKFLVRHKRREVILGWLFQPFQGLLRISLKTIFVALIIGVVIWVVLSVYGVLATKFAEVSSLKVSPASSNRPDPLGVGKVPVPSPSFPNAEPSAKALNSPAVDELLPQRRSGEGVVDSSPPSEIRPVQPSAGEEVFTVEGFQSNFTDRQAGNTNWRGRIVKIRGSDWKVVKGVAVSEDLRCKLSDTALQYVPSVNQSVVVGVVEGKGRFGNAIRLNECQFIEAVPSVDPQRN